tara:strand:- start:742 stop:930 length:189 start_codon:yes stop_codon:yes gene_type:complete
MFSPNKITKRYKSLLENLQYLEGEKLGLDPRVAKNQLKFIEEEIDLVSTEILKIEIKQRKGE